MARRSATWTRHDVGTCLDGSPAAFYYRAPRNGNTTSKFAIFLEGGGWCVSAADCVSRTATTLGSSASWGSNVRSPGSGGHYFDSAMLGAEFANSGLVHMKYCDGASFSGSSATRLTASYGSVQLGRQSLERGASFTIHSSGRATLMAALDLLLASPTVGLVHASDVLLSGCSAGGLAALLAAEAVHARLVAAGAPLVRFKVALFSGIFHSPAASPYTAQMRSVFQLAGMIPPPACARTLAKADAWRCVVGMRPLEALPAHIPVFVEQSAIDRWQTGCVLGAAPSKFETVRCSAGEWDSCLRYMHPLHPQQRTPQSAQSAQSAQSTSRSRRLGRELAARSAATAQQQQCSDSQLDALDSFSRDFMRSLVDSPALRIAGRGAFLHGCHSHCPTHLNRFAVNGATLERAMIEWWRAPADTPTAQHTHIGCLPTWGLNGSAGSSSLVDSAFATAPNCKPKCSTLYPWPDERRKIAKRSRAVDEALNGPEGAQE